VAKIWSPKPPANVRRPNVVTVANEKVPIATVLRLFGADAPEDVETASSRKISCPFGTVYHSDGGVAAAMRVYPESNSAYCFSCGVYYTPVSLAARALDTNRQTAALHLLDHVGLRPQDPFEAFQSAASYEPTPDITLLAEALKTYCRRVDPAWPNRQFEPEVAAMLTRCLGLLELVGSAEAVLLWLERCKEAMRSVLYRQPLSPSSKNHVS
jgi:hypothetical protein